MVVGHGIVRTVSPLTGQRRRLLEHDGEGEEQRRRASLLAAIHSFDAWNHTSSPCSTLVQAFVSASDERAVPGLGVVDMDTLERCIHWRRVRD